MTPIPLNVIAPNRSLPELTAWLANNTPTTLYHGTDKKTALKIAREGMRPGVDKTWKAESEEDMLYFTTKENIAYAWGEMRVKKSRHNWWGLRVLGKVLIVSCEAETLLKEGCTIEPDANIKAEDKEPTFPVSINGVDVGLFRGIPSVQVKPSGTIPPSVLKIFRPTLGTLINWKIDIIINFFIGKCWRSRAR